MNRIVSNKRQQHAPLVRSVMLGGTGAVTPQTAIENLGGVHESKIGNANGIAPLDSVSKIPAEFFPPLPAIDEPTLKGATEIYRADALNALTFDYVITNYDTTITYNVSTNRGSVTRVNDIITLVPTSQFGITVITINDKSFPIAITNPEVATPVFYAPMMNGSVSLIHINFGADISIMGALAETIVWHWQIATDVNFTDLIYDDVNDQDWYHTLALEGAYYARVRCDVDDWGLGFSMTTPWSDVVQFNATTLTASTTLLQVINDHPVPYDAFIAAGCALSPNGELLATNKVDLNYTISALIIYQKAAIAPHEYTAVATIPQPPEFILDGEFQFMFSADNQRLFVHRRYNDELEISYGSSTSRIFVYKTVINGDYSNWEIEQTLLLDLTAFGTSPVTNGLIHDSGVHFSLSADNTRLAVGVPEMVRFDSVLTDDRINNGVIIFVKDQTGIYQQTYVINEPNINTLSASPVHHSFGQCVNFNHNATRLVVLAPSAETYDANGDSLNDGRGAIYIYELDGNDDYNLVYTYQISEITDGISALNSEFVAASQADVIVTGAWDPSKVQILFILEKINNVWSFNLSIPPAWDDGNSTLCGRIGGLAINSEGTFLAIGSPYSSTIYSASTYTTLQSPFNETGYVYLYNKSDGWSYTDILTHDVIEGIYSGFGTKLSLSANNELAVFADEYDRWTTYDIDFITNPYQGAVLIYK